MNRIVYGVLAAAIAVGIVVAFGTTQDTDAKSTKKVHFTRTVESSHDPGIGFEGRQLVLLLSPIPGVIYDGSLTFAADLPVRPVVLHEIGADDARGQPVWSIDNRTFYAQSLLDGGRAGSVEFTGAVLGLSGAEPFVATASVDGWLRGGSLSMPPPEIKADVPPSIVLYGETVPFEMPLRTALYDGNKTKYVIFDVDAAETVRMADWNASVAPTLINATGGELYVFLDGVRGDGLYQYQSEVLSDTPEQENYTAVKSVMEVSWVRGQNPQVLESASQIREAEEGGRISITKAGAVNAPQVSWPGGAMGTGHDSQILNITGDLVVFAAHRAWGPDGRTTYYVAVDATPLETAEILGVPLAGTGALAGTGVAPKIYQFKNGIAGSGMLGFQPEVVPHLPGDEGYSPLRSPYIVEWAGNATVLQTVSDIESAASDGLVTISIARPLYGHHVVNAPLVSP